MAMELGDILEHRKEGVSKVLKLLIHPLNL